MTSPIEKTGRYRLRPYADLLLSLVLSVLGAPLLLLLTVLELAHGGRVQLKRTLTAGQFGVPFQRPSLVVERLKESRLARALRPFPQLYCVLKQSMSLVGPEPHSYQNSLVFAERLPEHRLRLEAKPGIFSPACLAPPGSTWQQKCDLEILYVQRAHLTFDLWLLGNLLVRRIRGSKS